MYSYIKDNQNNKTAKGLKGLKGIVIKNDLKHEDYKRPWFDNQQMNNKISTI